MSPVHVLPASIHNVTLKHDLWAGWTHQKLEDKVPSKYFVKLIQQGMTMEILAIQSHSGQHPSGRLGLEEEVSETEVNSLFQAGNCECSWAVGTEIKGKVM